MKTAVVLAALFAVVAADTQWNTHSTEPKTELQKPTHVAGSSPVAYTTTYATGAPVQWNGQHWTQWDEHQQKWNEVPVTKSAWNWNAHQTQQQPQPAQNWNTWNTKDNTNWNTNTNAQARSMWPTTEQWKTQPSHSQTWNGQQWNTAVPVARSSWTSGTPSHVWTNNNNWNTVPVARSSWSSQPSTWNWNTAAVPAWNWNNWNTNTYASSWPWTYYVAA